MMITTKGRYGIRALLDLAINSGPEHIALGKIAERQNISMNYLEQVFSVLKRAGIVNSIKGAYGGYKLSAKPSELMVGKVLRTLEGDIAVVETTQKGETDPLRTTIKELVWDRVDQSIKEVLDNMTFQELIDAYHEKKQKMPLMFNI